MAESNGNAAQGEIKSSGSVLYLASSGPGKRKRGKVGKSEKYHFPKILLRQTYFCRSHGGHGEWSDPVFSLGMLGNKEFVSQIGALLDRLEADGHHVKGPRIEWLAYRDLAISYSEMFKNLWLRPTESTVATHLYKSSDK